MKAASKLVASVLKLDLKLTEEFMDKLSYDIRLVQPSVDHLKMVEGQVKCVGKLLKPVEWSKFVYPDLLKKQIPDKASYELPR